MKGAATERHTGAFYGQSLEDSWRLSPSTVPLDQGANGLGGAIEMVVGAKNYEIAAFRSLIGSAQIHGYDQCG